MGQHESIARQVMEVGANLKDVADALDALHIRLVALELATESISVPDDEPAKESL